MLESAYQAKLIKRLRRMFPGCVILKNDSSYMPGVPDLSIFYGPHWVMLEVKSKIPRPGTDDFEPNQEWYIEQFNKMSLVTWISPEVENEVLSAVQTALEPERQTRVSESEPIPLDSVRRSKTRRPSSRIHGSSSGNRTSSTRA